METQHEIEPTGRTIQRSCVVASILGGVTFVYAWWGGRGPYSWFLTALIAVIWWLTFQMLRMPNTIVLRADGTLEFSGLGPSRRIHVSRLKWVRRLDRSLVLVRYRGGFLLLTRWYTGFEELMKEIKRRNDEIRVSI